MRKLLDAVGVVPAIFTLIFSMAGGIGGMSVGIAAGGGASDGSLFMALVFGLIGFFGASWLDLKFKLSQHIVSKGRQTQRLLK